MEMTNVITFTNKGIEFQHTNHCMSLYFVVMLNDAHTRQALINTYNHPSILSQ